ncbi:hypothetical protein [Gemmatimonas phototrophica]|uniref:hypothetical protein n=1 Tax=Gemmatimonas phototrophica TaxID=1379270 RepID=UPI00131440EA|nr:hypothetical protein [Gemmatimonas phototrophica]
MALDRQTAVAGGITALTLLLGYVDLWRGGDIMAPMLLVLGYVIGVPATLLATSRDWQG